MRLMLCTRQDAKRLCEEPILCRVFFYLSAIFTRCLVIFRLAAEAVSLNPTEQRGINPVQ